MNSNPTNPETLLCASWLAPMDQPPLRDAALLIQNDRIAAIGPIADLRARFPNANVIDLPNTILTPGLINAHTHLELTNTKCPPPPPGGFVQWIESLMQQAPPESQLPQSITAAINEGIHQCLQYGVTTIGDISRQSHLTRPLLQKSPLRVVGYGEIQAMAQRRTLLDTRLATALTPPPGEKTNRFHLALSPHAPYSVEPTGYTQCLAAAKAQSLPLSTHLAENPFETEFLNTHTGPFRDLWTWLNAWDDHVPFSPGSPVQFAKSLGLLDYPTLLAHVNYCDDNDLNLLAKGQASVVYCPRTHQFFQHPPHRWQQMLHQGINVASGTDSCASSPNLNLLDDLRLLRQIAPEIPALELWQLATLRAARALTLQSQTGSLTPTKYADLLAFPAQGPDPLQSILDLNLSPTQIWIAGEPIARISNE